MYIHVIHMTSPPDVFTDIVMFEYTAYSGLTFKLLKIYNKKNQITNQNSQYKLYKCINCYNTSF